MAAKKTEQKSPRDVLAALRKEHNSDKATIGSPGEFEKVTGYSTGNISLDFLTGVGGFPKGRIVETHGEFSSGKTTAALQAMAVEQQRTIADGDEKYVMFFDFERSIDPEYCAKLGLDVDHESFIYVKPEHFEHGANIFRQMLDTGAVSIAVFDSVAAMVSEKELSSETGKVEFAARAKAMHQFCRQITGQCERHDTTAIFLNHTMEKVDSTPMGQRLAAQGIKRMTQPGGTALPFYGSLRVEFKKTTKVKTNTHDAITDATDKMVTGQDITATVVKNKVGAAFGTAALRVRFGKGFSQPYSVLAILKAHNVVKVKTGGYHQFPADLTVQGELFSAQGEDQVLTLIEKNPEWLDLLMSKAQSLLSAYGLEKVDSDLYDSNGQVKDSLPAAALPEVDENNQIVWEDPDDMVVNTQTGEIQ